MTIPLPDDASPEFRAAAQRLEERIDANPALGLAFTMVLISQALDGLIERVAKIEALLAPGGEA